MIDNTKVLALKYRPQKFEDLIGQDIASKTISNSIKSNKVPNAYLFTGIRGVGKTTIARIVAKSLNCSNGFKNLCTDKLCENCKSISNSNHIDVLEMDAASKTGGDDVRDLIEFSRYGPTTAKYKIFIIDEVHMLSKQGCNALLKTLEEPPEYLKFIFATTEIKKIPVTVVSRCQRFDLSRVKSSELFDFIKKVSIKENGKIKDDAIKLIVKISEGSVRDALSLLDRALITQDTNKELDLNSAQKIFGYYDKSVLLELLKFIFEGNEKEVLKKYRNIYDQGVDPKIFLNDFLEVIYYLKNITVLKVDGTSFSLNDEEFNLIKEMANSVDNETLLLFWQFTIKTLDEIEIVSNQNLSIEMFLIRLIHLKSMPNLSELLNNKESLKECESNTNGSKLNQDKKEISNDLFDIKNKTIGQIKNVTQEKNQTQEKILNTKKEKYIEIKSFEDLIKICNLEREIKLKYELETNVSLVSFQNQRIEISFNEKLDKNFIKNLSSKLFIWTNKRWIISLSKKSGEPSKKDQNTILKKKLIEETKKKQTYKKFLEVFPDAELIDIEKNNEK